MKSRIEKTTTGRIVVVDKMSFDGWHDKVEDVFQKNITKFKHLTAGVYEIHYTYATRENYDPYMFGYSTKIFIITKIVPIKPKSL